MAQNEVNEKLQSISSDLSSEVGKTIKVTVDWSFITSPAYSASSVRFIYFNLLYPFPKSTLEYAF
jgi:hypothetical protein